MLSLEKQNKWREKYQATHRNWRPATEQFADVVKSFVHTDARILDLGCGRGGLVEQLNALPQQVVGLDPDWLSLREHRLDIPRVQALSDALPFSAQSFDVIYCSWVLEHLQRPFLTFRAIGNVLKPGGVFIFITPNSAHPLAKLNQLFGRLGHIQGKLVEMLYSRTEDDTFSTYYRANSATALQTLSAQSGLHIQELRFIPDPTYLAFSPLFYKASCWLENKLPSSHKIHLVGILQKE